jgi:hypothetical protein
MIRFFRNIRQKLAAENKVMAYLRYAIGEILLVVIGILIALQINNWNENRKLDKSRQEYYRQLLIDLNKDKESANNFIERFKKEREEYNNYLKLYEKKNLTPSEVYNKLMKLNLASGFMKFNSNTIESLRSSGELILFPLEIRNKLLDLKVLQDNILEMAKHEDNHKADVIRSMSLIRGASTLDSRLKNQPRLKSFLKFNNNLPQIILGLDATHRWKDYSETESITSLTKMIKDINLIIYLINNEINK